ncbi:MAG: hypothetical protein QM710_10030 [Flavobacterium sp.]
MSRNDKKYLILLTAIYFAVSLLGILHHELWLDESQHWLLARDSNSVSGFIQNTRFEGHPLLWGFMLYAITRFTSDPFWMQFLHILIATGTVLVFLRKAPFGWLFKLLFIFGYFMVFEYSLISRNYNLGILFLFLACAFFEKRDQKFPLICLFLALAANSHLLFGIPAFALFLTLLLEQMQNRKLFKRHYVVGYLVFAGGLILAYIQIHSTDSSWLLEPIKALSFRERIAVGLGSFFKGIIAIPDFRTMHFWNTNLIINGSKPVAIVLALLVYLLPLLLFFKNRKTLFFVYTALIGAQVFFFVTQRNAIRFHGMAFILIIIGLWIENYYHSESYWFREFLNSRKLTLLKKPIIYSLLLIHFCSGIYAYSMDLNYPFTEAKNVADYLNTNGLASKKIATVAADAAVISPYLGRRIYSLRDKDWESYCRWERIYWKEDFTVPKIGNMIAEFAQKNDFILISNFPEVDSICSDPKRLPAISIRKLKSFKDCILENSAFSIYEIKNIR